MITISFRHPNAANISAKMHGFRYLWLKYVRGFNPDRHCQTCLVGPVSPKIKRDMLLGTELALDEVASPFLYLCGVSTAGWANNLHIAMEPRAGNVIRETTNNGIQIVIMGAVKLDIPALPNGFRGLNKSFTTCRNFQFGVTYLEHAGNVKDAKGIRHS